MSKYNYLFEKYYVTKRDGRPTDPDAKYFPLKLNSDPDARKAVALYAYMIKDKKPELSKDINEWLAKVYGEYYKFEYSKVEKIFEHDE